MLVQPCKLACSCSKLVGEKDVSSERYALNKLNHFESISDEHLNKSIHLSMPNLKLVKMHTFDISVNVSQFLLLLEKLGVVLEIVVIVPAQVGETLISPLFRTKQAQEGIFFQGPPHFEVSEN